VASLLSRGWIRIAGHYYSEEAKKAKEMIFPIGYDATKMFWLVNKSGAYGARSALLPVAREIVAGVFKGAEARDILAACEYDGTSMSCYMPTGMLKRVAALLRHGARFTFE
jgi:hypothetical protein